MPPLVITRKLLVNISATSVVVAAALWVGGAGVVLGSHVAGGADSYGYVSQAALWARGDLVIEQPVAESLPWPHVDATLSPLGYRPGLAPGTIVPIYGPGLPMVMAVFQRIGGPAAVFLVVPLMGLLAVLAAAGLAARVSGPTAGVVTAWLLAASPTMVFCVMWPMSDAATAGWWAIVAFMVTRGGPLSAGAAGTAALLAILTRPNLVALALAPSVYLAVRALREKRRDATVRLLVFLALVATGCVAVAAVNHVLYGSPLASGYGSLSTFFETTRRPYNPDGFPIRPLINARGFLLRPLEVDPALVVCGLLGSLVVLIPSAPGDARRIGRLCIGFIGLLFGSYLFFRSNPEWWYLRLLLPAYPAAAVLAGIGVAWVAARLPAVARIAMLAGLATFAVSFGHEQMRARDVFLVRQNEARYESVGRFVADVLPENAVLLAAQQSGSLRYYAGRLTVRFDVLESHWLERAIEALRDLGYVPYFVIEEQERAVFIERFASTSRLGRLDWQPVIEFREATPVSIYDPRDHPAFESR